jgi:hypothetical protein
MLVINQHGNCLLIIWSFVPNRTNVLPTSTYLMWYNVIPLYVFLDLNLYLAYPNRTKGFDPYHKHGFLGHGPRLFKHMPFLTHYQVRQKLYS